jgi:hypothetical protein
VLIWAQVLGFYWPLALDIMKPYRYKDILVESEILMGLPKLEFLTVDALVEAGLE